MSLRAQAQSDLQYIMEGDAAGFRWPIVVTNPALVSAALFGFSSDIAQVIDPETGQIVSGRLATVAIRIGALTAVGLTLPVGVPNSASKPWVIDFDDINGNPCKFKVKESNPDRALGLVVCILENYQQ